MRGSGSSSSSSIQRWPPRVGSRMKRKPPRAHESAGLGVDARRFQSHDTSRITAAVLAQGRFPAECSCPSGAAIPRRGGSRKCARKPHGRSKKWQATRNLARERRTQSDDGMKRVRSPAWATLFVLGMLCLRALVPPGYMLAPAQEHAAMVLCHAAMPWSERAQNSVKSGRDATAHHGGAHSDPDCPYAQSAGPAPLPTLPALAQATLCVPDDASVRVTQNFSTCGPTRRQSPRGPPSPA